MKGTSLLSDALARLSRPPSVFVSASAIGYYGNRGDEVVDREEPARKRFLSGRMCRMGKGDKPAVEKGIRTIHTRFGIILDANDGALAKMLTPFRMGIGGRVGDGKQWMSWIAIEDVVNGLKFLMEDKSASGPVNFVAPNAVTNAEFTKTLGSVLSKPTLFPVPGVWGEIGVW